MPIEVPRDDTEADTNEEALMDTLFTVRNYPTA
jgi:hypothetical protein